MENRIHEAYANRLRVRVCGLCWQDGRLLMVNHRGLAQGDFWAPPGGGVEFGESIEDRLQTEFAEETGLVIRREKLAFVCEFRRDALHAVELFFDVSIAGGKLQVGTDPELDIIEAVSFMSPDEIAALPPSAVHGIFSKVKTAHELRSLAGFFTI